MAHMSGGQGRLICVYRWNSFTIQERTSKILPNLDILQDDIRRLATNLDVKLQAMQQASVASDQQDQINGVNNLKSCVRSAATVLSSASSMASNIQGTFYEVDDDASEFEGDWFQAETVEATKSWVSLQRMDRERPDASDRNYLAVGTAVTTDGNFAAVSPSGSFRAGKLYKFSRYK